MSSPALFPRWQRDKTVQHGKLCPLLVILGAFFVCRSCLGQEGGTGNLQKSSHCPRQGLKEPQQIQLLQPLSLLSSSCPAPFQSFDLQNASKDWSDKGKSSTEEESSSA